MRHHFLGVFLVCISLATSAISQTTYADSYTFLQAVKERDSATAIKIINELGSVALNSRDRTNGEGALHYLVRGRDANWLAFLLGKGARPNLQSNRGDTPLTLAVQIGWLEGAESLLARAASVDLANGRGETPLIIATQRRDLPLVRLLLSRRADPLRTDNVAGMSALDYARQDPRGTGVLSLLEGATKR